MILKKEIVIRVHTVRRFFKINNPIGFVKTKIKKPNSFLAL